MDERSHAFLKELLETPSPSGYERPVQDVVRRWAAPLADEVRTDRHGNVIAALFPQQNSPDPAIKRARPGAFAFICVSDPVQDCAMLALLALNVPLNAPLNVKLVVWPELSSAKAKVKEKA